MKTLDILITGRSLSCREDLEKILEKLCSNYNYINVYTIGAPSNGINRQASDYAFLNRCPLTLGAEADADQIGRKLAAAEHAAVLCFTDRSGQTDSARYIARHYGIQAKFIA